ncbi:hypothetical protein VIMS_02133 [Mycobacterium marinum]|nr:hypothetical protein VIMS_02133 [Mycobacterium marinum]RFZ28188.1 hypothetical protein DSM44344_01646 [Mycobacterium marinum]RFZ28191.1 hypothetical protein NCTC2275_04430 [Mycobacterium marinum]
MAPASPVLAAMLVPVVMVVCCGGPVGLVRGAGKVGPVPAGTAGLVEEAACSVGMVVAAGPVVPGRVVPVVVAVLVGMRGCSVSVGLVAWVAPASGSRPTLVCHSVVRAVPGGVAVC